VIPKVVKASVVLNSKALSLPKPSYPPLARQIKVQGMVTVQVLIDEAGKVISARAVSGHPLLIAEAQKAALQARFSPTTISDQPVKVSGVITYNFIIQ
jgi:protein TonB